MESFHIFSLMSREISTANLITRGSTIATCFMKDSLCSSARCTFRMASGLPFRTWSIAMHAVVNACLYDAGGLAASAARLAVSNASRFA